MSASVREYLTMTDISHMLKILLPYALVISAIAHVPVTISGRTVTVVDSSTLDSGTLVKRVLLISQVAVLKNVDGDLVEEGVTFFTKQVLNDPTYIKLSSEHSAFVLLYSIPRSEPWFLPTTLECVRGNLLHVAFLVLTADDEIHLVSECVADQLQCVVQGQVSVSVQGPSGPSSVAVLKEGECLFLPRGHSVEISGGGLAVTWLWTTPNATTFDGRDCSLQARARLKARRLIQRCDPGDSPRRCERLGTELNRTASPARAEVITRHLTNKVCRSQANEVDFFQSLREEFAQVSANDEVWQSIKVHTSRLFDKSATSAKCDDADSFDAIHRIAQELAADGISIDGSKLSLQDLCSVSLPSGGVRLVFAGETSAADGNVGDGRRLSFFKLNDLVEPVALVDGHLSPQDLFNTYTAEFRPVLLKGIARALPAYRRWRNKYLVKTLVADSVPSESIHDEFQKLAGGSSSPLNGPLPRDLWGDIHFPSPICDGVVQERFLGATIRTAVSHDSDSDGGLQYDMFDRLACQLDGYADVALISPEYAGSLSFEPGTRKCDANLNQLDISRYGTLLRTPWKMAAIEPGDCIYLPSRWIYSSSHHKRSVVVDFRWNPLVEPVQHRAAAASSCSFNGDSIDESELLRLQLLEGTSTPLISLDDLAKAFGETLRPPANAVAIAKELLKAVDHDSDDLASHDELLLVNRSALRVALDKSREHDGLDREKLLSAGAVDVPVESADGESELHDEL